MSEKPNSEEKPFDPTEPWRGVRDAYLDAWSKSMIEMVNNEAYAKASGALLDTSLTASAPFREAIEKSMLKALEQLAMPTRADIVSIAERMTNIEMRLDDLDAKLDRICAPAVKVAQRAVPAAPGHARQRKKSARRSKAVKRGK